MKTLLLTTALVSLIAAMPVQAQTTTSDTTTDTTGTVATTGGTVTPPEGYTSFEVSTLTVDDLKGATIYDANGESVGAISDVVMASTTTGTRGASAHMSS